MIIVNHPYNPVNCPELSSQQEYLKLKARYEALQRSQRNLLGEDLGPLNSKELESLERQLDMSLKQIRSTRTQAMLDTLTDLQRNEHTLNEANRSLKQRLMEGSEISLQWNPNGEDVDYGRQPTQPHAAGFFHHLECEPTLHIGYQHDPITDGAAGPSLNNYMYGLLGRLIIQEEDFMVARTWKVMFCILLKENCARPTGCGKRKEDIASNSLEEGQFREWLRASKLEEGMKNPVEVEQDNLKNVENFSSKEAIIVPQLLYKDNEILSHDHNNELEECKEFDIKEKVLTTEGLFQSSNNKLEVIGRTPLGDIHNSIGIKRDQI
ncbi:hypothetical protein DH2020_003797 [Rehmannia glutinosa]|uniref:K-box domain-containing protein n=1 Tax=Rehmannia glutinosa TaxID=99300 RepID=A0ABR0XML7_REHGL